MRIILMCAFVCFALKAEIFEEAQLHKDYQTWLSHQHTYHMSAGEFALQQAQEMHPAYRLINIYKTEASSQYGSILFGAETPRHINDYLETASAILTRGYGFGGFDKSKKANFNELRIIKDTTLYLQGRVSSMIESHLRQAQAQRNIPIGHLSFIQSLFNAGKELQNSLDQQINPREFIQTVNPEIREKLSAIRPNGLEIFKAYCDTIKHPEPEIAEELGSLGKYLFDTQKYDGSGEQNSKVEEALELFGKNIDEFRTGYHFYYQEYLNRLKIQALEGIIGREKARFFYKYFSMIHNVFTPTPMETAVPAPNELENFVVGEFEAYLEYCYKRSVSGFLTLIQTALSNPSYDAFRHKVLTNFEDGQDITVEALLNSLMELSIDGENLGLLERYENLLRLDFSFSKNPLVSIAGEFLNHQITTFYSENPATQAPPLRMYGGLGAGVGMESAWAANPWTGSA